MILCDPLLPKPPSPEGVRLTALLADPDAGILPALSSAGELARLVPEWGRVAGSRNIQHSAHHFPLDRHTFNVVEGTRTSPYFAPLDPYAKQLSLLAALLHDVDKHTGPNRLRGLIPVDKLHPIKSAEMSLPVLGRLGFSADVLARVYTLIHHHQILGRQFIIYPNGAPDAALMPIVLKMRSTGMLNCLLALSEGDISGVRDEDSYFTPKVGIQLAQYADTLRAQVGALRQRLAPAPQAWHTQHDRLDTATSAGFYLAAPDWETLVARVAAMPWGGAVRLPYAAPKSDALHEGPFKALFRILPEHIADFGPADPAPPMALRMDAFYHLLSGQTLTDHAMPNRLMDWVVERRSCQDKYLRPQLDAAAIAAGGQNWAALAVAADTTLFQPDADNTALTAQLAEVGRRIIGHFSGPWAGVVTRPILSAIVAPPGRPVTLPDAWAHLPVLRLSH